MYDYIFMYIFYIFILYFYIPVEKSGQKTLKKFYLQNFLQIFMQNYLLLNKHTNF